MIDLGLEDVKQLLLDLYLCQRENAILREQLAQYQETQNGTLKDRDGEVI